MAAEVKISVSLDGVAATKSGLASVSDTIKDIGKSAEDVGKRMIGFGTTMSRIGGLLTLGITTPIATAVSGLFSLASAANETQNLFEVSFGEMKDDATEFVRAFAQQSGLAQVQLKQMSGQLFSMTTGMGLSRDAAFLLSTSLVRLAGDLSSLYNIGTEEAFLKLRSGLVGEAEPLRALGILVNENTIKQELFKRGLIGTGEELSEQQKVLGRYLTVLSQTSTAQGDLAATAGSPANAIRILTSQVQEAATEFGESLLPAFAAVIRIGRDVLDTVNEMAGKFTALPESTKAAVIAVGLLVAGIGPLITVLGLVISTAGFVLGVMGKLVVAIGALVSPAGLALAAMVAFTAGLILIERHQEQVANVVKVAWLNIELYVQKSVQGILAGINAIGQFIPGLSGALGAAIADMGKRVSDTTREIFAAGTVGAAVGNLYEEVKKDVASGIDSTMAALAEPMKKFQDFLFGGGGPASDERGRATVKKLYEDQAKEAEKLFKTLSDGAVESGKGAKKAAKEQSDAIRESTKVALDSMKDRQKAEKDLLDYQIKAGIISYEEAARIADQKLLVFRQSLQFEYLSTAEALEKEIGLREQALDFYDKAAQEQIASIRRITGITDEAAKEQLEIELDKYKNIGEAGTKAAERIGEEIEKLDQHSERVATRQRSLYEDLIDDSSRLGFSLSSGLQRFFVDTVKSGFDFGLSMKKLFQSIADAILEEFARIAANQVFAVLFGSTTGQQAAARAGSGIVSGGGLLGSASSGPGGLLSGLGLGGGGGLSSLLSPISNFLGFGGSSLTGSLFSTLGSGVGNTANFGSFSFAGAGDAIGSATSGIASGIGSYIGPIIGGVVNLINGDIKKAIASTTLGIAGTVLGNALLPGIGGFIGGGLGSFFGGLFQRGGEAIFSQPTFIGVGEKGAERVFVEPLAGGTGRGGGSGTVIQFVGPTILDEYTLQAFIDEVSRRMKGRA